MKKILIFVLCAAMLVLPFCSASAGFAEDMATFRTLYDQLPHAGSSFTDERVDSACQYVLARFLRETNNEYPYYVIIPTFGTPSQTVSSSSPYLYFHIFASRSSEGFEFSLRHYLEPVSGSSFDATFLDSYPDFDTLEDYYRYLYSFSPVALPDDCVYYYTYLSLSSSNWIYNWEGPYDPDLTTSDTLSSRAVVLIYADCFRAYNTSTETFSVYTNDPIVCVPSLEFFSLNTYSTVDISYQSQGEATDSGVTDFFSPQSLSVIISTEANYLERVIHRGAEVLSICGVGLLASLIGLGLLPKVFRKFGIV